MTQPGALIGTPAFMPPEQAGDEPGKIGPHSDVYSLGAILYTLLTGKPPFDEPTAFKTILKVISDATPEPSATCARETPPRLEQICMKCLEKEPKDRYPGAQALADDLKRFRAALTSKSAPASLRASLPTLVLVTPAGKQVRLFNQATVIGRHQDCDLVIKVSEISKRHCRILLSPDQAAVEDLGSSNGTFVNGEQIGAVSRRRMATSWIFGGHIFQVRMPGTGAK